MKILHVIERFNPIIGGAEMQAQQLIKKQLGRGIEADVLTRKIDQKMKEYEEIEGIKVFRIGPENFNEKFAFAWNVYKFIKKSDYHLIHVHGVYSIFGMACILSGKKVIGKITNSRGSLKQNKLIKFLKLLILKHIHKIVIISKQINLEVRKMGFKKSKTELIPNGVDINLFQKERKSYFRKKVSLPLKRPIAAFSGRLVHQKGLDVLLKAILTVVKKEPNLLLLIFGTGDLQIGSLENKLKKFVKVNKLTKNVKFRGNVTNLNEYLKAADFFFFPSRREGLPNALLEAASTGLPIVASRIGGNVDIIKNGYNGLLFESENVEELAKKIIYLLNNKKLQQKFAKNARKTVIENFSLDVICDKYIKLYHSLI
jgi:glycosyltransferase involved in cell wall biosynthesis